MHIMHRGVSEHSSLRINLHLHLTSMGEILLHGIDTIETFLVKIELLIIFNVYHLVLQELLHVLILPQYGQFLTISFDTILPCIFVDHIGPELILLFLE